MNASTPALNLSTAPASRFWREWFGHSLHFPILNILLENLVSDPLYSLLSPSLVSLLIASLLQAWVLSRWEAMANPRRLLGNLIGPATFSAIGVSLQWTEFFSAPNHIAYWVFGLLFGLIQSVPPAKNNRLRVLLALGEALLRGAMAASMYYILRARLDPIETMRIPDFLAQPENLFVILVFLLLGLAAGFYRLTLAPPQKTPPDHSAEQERTWQKQPNNPAANQPARREERILLAMTIRGLTRWSEARQPEETISLLNRYYQTAESTLQQHHALKFKLRGGEVLAFFSGVDDGLQAALKLRLQINALLHRHGLGVGIGLHAGPVIEGWLGGKDTKMLDAWGDSVELARNIEVNAGLGELLVSEKMRIAIGATFRAGPKRFLSLPDRDEPVVVYPLE